MKNSPSKFIALLLSLLVFVSSLSADEEFCCEFEQEPATCCYSHPRLEVKAGYFFFTNSKLRKIYDKGGFDIQLAGSYPIWNMSSCWTLNAYGAVEYFERSGRSINGHQKTSVWSVPVNVGLKPVYSINDCLQYYFAIGPRYFYLHQNNHSSYVFKNRSKSGVGLFVNTGFNYLLCDHFVIDLFGEYSYAKLHFKGEKEHVYTRDIQIGGFTFGGGLGYEF